MSRFITLAVAGLAATALTAGSLTEASAAPLPALNAEQVAGAASTVDHVGWRGGYGGYYGRPYGYGHGGYGYRRRNVAGALFAGAALGLIGGAIAANAAPRYGYYGGYGYPAYGYAPVYGGYPAYGYGYPYGW